VLVLHGQGTVQPKLFSYIFQLFFTGLWAEHCNRGISGYQLYEKKDNDCDQEKDDET
jgi:hypothetical protein